MQEVLLEPREDTKVKDGSFHVRKSHRALEKGNVLVICILYVWRLIAVMVKAVIGMTI